MLAALSSAQARGEGKVMSALQGVDRGQAAFSAQHPQHLQVAIVGTDIPDICAPLLDAAFDVLDTYQVALRH